MTDILVDSNVILDVVTEDPQWFEWSAQMLTNYAEQGNLVINPIIYAEISIGFNQPEEVEASLPEDFFRRDSLPYAAAFLAGQSFLEYRRHGGERRSPLPDFYNIIRGEKVKIVFELHHGIYSSCTESKK